MNWRRLKSRAEEGFLLVLLFGMMVGLRSVSFNSPPAKPPDPMPQVKRRMESPPTVRIQRERLTHLIKTRPEVARYVLVGNSPDQELRRLAEEALARGSLARSPVPR